MTYIDYSLLIIKVLNYATSPVIVLFSLIVLCIRFFRMKKCTNVVINTWDLRVNNIFAVMWWSAFWITTWWYQVNQYRWVLLTGPIVYGVAFCSAFFFRKLDKRLLEMSIEIDAIRKFDIDVLSRYNPDMFCIKCKDVVVLRYEFKNHQQNAEKMKK